MNAEAYLKFYYPFMFVETDNRNVSPEQVATALQIASRYIPDCLSDDEKAEAQAHYAAYVLGTIIQNKQSGGGSDSETTVTGPIKAVSEGDGEWQYYAPAAADVSSKDFSGGLKTAFDKYTELASKCLPRLRTVRI